MAGYLDDITFGDSVSKLVGQIQDFEKESSLIGLSLNHVKSEVMGLSCAGVLEWGCSDLDFKQCVVGQESLLGSPLRNKGVDTVLNTQVAVLRQFATHLLGLSTHESFYLMNNSLAIPRLMFLLRSSPCFLSPVVTQFDLELLRVMTSVSNCAFTDTSWSHASLPVRFGGLGILSLGKLAAPAYMASARFSHELLRQIIPMECSSWHTRQKPTRCRCMEATGRPESFKGPQFMYTKKLVQPHLSGYL